MGLKNALDCYMIGERLRLHVMGKKKYIALICMAVQS